MSESRGSQGTPIHYTMKTPHTTRPSPGPLPAHGRSHSRSSTQTKKSGRSSKPSTPLASPRMPYSVGQAYPPQPKLSPGRIPDVRSPSPNYFGLIPEQHLDPRDSSTLPRENWSPPTSSVRSFTAAIPKQGPIEANSDYEAFKRQADLNRGGESFHLSTSHFSPATQNPPNTRPKAPPRWNTHASDNVSLLASQRNIKEPSSTRMDVERDSVHDSAYVSAESKRNSEASMQPPSFFGLQRFESPQPTEASSLDRRSMLSKVEDRHPRLSMTQNRIDPPSPNLAASSARRAETEPVKGDSGPSLITPSQLKELTDSAQAETDMLLLDLRVSQQYMSSRIKGALNLCTPPTLLKRATFNLQKLQQTFQSPGDKERFAKWASTKYLVVYDAHSAEKRDAVSCLNMIKKFANEGYTGKSYILRGGFKAAQDECSEIVDQRAAAASGGPQLSNMNRDANRTGIPPVMGGVMLPQASNDPNPFFSNIRQNMDLADGVGQLDIARPSALDSPTLPRWLRDASKSKDHGKQVSERFLHIEKEEQSRMKQAYSMFNPASKPIKSDTVQLCGVEKGGKNRYKDILPFEHARVKLQGRPAGACDYVNASYLKASGSNKRYIATQGPLPATFEDFWSVIWDQDVRVIVMLTAESEGGTLKCHPYWRGRDFGNLKLKLLSEKKVSLDIDKHRSSSQASSMGSSSSSGFEFGRRRANTTTTLEGSTPTPQPMPNQGEAPYVIIRKFALAHAQHPFAPLREITHLHFPSWPDFGTPAQPSHLLALVELANVMQRAALPIDTPAIAAKSTEAMPMTWFDEPDSETDGRPMLVHCSAGCGRTGAFCTVDTVIDMLKRQRLSKIITKPVRKRDSDGDIKMSGEREVDEPVSPRTAQEKAFNFAPPKQRTSAELRRISWDGPSLDTTWVGDDTIDLIAKTVEDFRKQRLSMVQSLRQFVLCYETTLEYLSRLHEKSAITIVPGTGRARSGSLQFRKET